MNAIGVASACEFRTTMQAQARAATADHRQQGSHQGHLFVFGEILLAHAHPAAPGHERPTYDFGQWAARLAAVRHQEKWRIG
jgi:hypothetical protein